MREEWVQNLQDEKKWNAVHIDTKLNLADMFTKCLAAPVRNKLEETLDSIAEGIAKQ